MSENKKRKAELIPSKRCIFCNKTIEEIGGRRLIATGFKAVFLSEKYHGGGKPDYPFKSVKLDESSGLYVSVQGEKGLWTDELIEKARQEFLHGRHPWFCQVCGNRKCKKCGAPLNFPAGTDVLYDNGCSGHVMLVGINAGCVNPDCENYKEWKPHRIQTDK
jgi:hypothetical protein